MFQNIFYEFEKVRSENIFRASNLKITLKKAKIFILKIEGCRFKL